MTSVNEQIKSSNTTTLRKKLGRGLGSLISGPVRIDVAHTEATQPVTHIGGGSLRNRVASIPIEGEMVMLELASVRPNPRQPRQDFDEESIKALAASIAKSGLMQPIVVRPDQAGGYEIIAGERRWRASQVLGLQRISAIVRSVDDRAAAQFSLVENLQREDLNPIERAEAFSRLIDEFGLTHQDVAESIGWDRSSVTNHLRLNELDEFSKDAVRAERLSLGHAKVLLGFTNLERRRSLAGQAVQHAWSVRELERHAKDAQAQGPDSNAPGAEAVAPLKSRVLSAHMTDLQKRLGAHLGTKIHIKPGRNKGSGKLIIEFFTIDQFEGLLTQFGFENSDA